jgi:hypothetical protein
MHSRRIRLGTCSVDSYAFPFDRLTISAKHRSRYSLIIYAVEDGSKIPTYPNSDVQPYSSYINKHASLIVDPPYPIHHLRLY